MNKEEIELFEKRVIESIGSIYDELVNERIEEKDEELYGEEIGILVEISYDIRDIFHEKLKKFEPETEKDKFIREYKEWLRTG